MGVTDEIKKIVETAIQLEKDGVKFYTDAAETDLHPLGKAMFSSFIEEEKKHIRKLEDLLMESGSGEGAPVQAKLEDIFENVKTVFRKMYKEDEVMVDVNTDDLKAIKTAIDFEKDGSNIYIEAAKATTDKLEKEIFTFLGNEEESHLQALKNMHRELEDAYKQAARQEDRTRLDWERKMFMRPDAEAKKIREV